jgi:hypothetical protein
LLISRINSLRKSSGLLVAIANPKKPDDRDGAWQRAWKRAWTRAWGNDPSAAGRDTCTTCDD